jgi:uncharacterized repeat protein (TIGR03803 family)
MSKRAIRIVFHNAVTGLPLALAMSTCSTFIVAQTLPRNFTALYDFHGGSDGAWPSGVVVGKDGALFGTTYNGGRGQCGASGYPQPCGTVFTLVPPAESGKSWTETVLYRFAGGVDGAQPIGGVTIGPDGALYGATYRGGMGHCDQVVSGCGTVFRLTPPSVAGSAWTKTTLYRFTGAGDGSSPSGPLVFKDGKLYGTAMGGPAGFGTVFQLTAPGAAGGEWTLSTLYSFAGGTDGGIPGTLNIGRNGQIYGTTGYGGDLTCIRGEPYQGCGTVFELAQTTVGWQETVLYRFSGAFPGAFPTAGLVKGANGALYGSTSGYIFQLIPPAVDGGAWMESTLYAFPAFCADAGCEWNPLNAPLAMALDGTLYNTTVGGGLHECNYAEGYCGTAFALAPPLQPGDTWKPTYLHAFEGLAGGEGANPEAGLAIGQSGVLYGTTLYGGSGICDESGLPYGCGVVFELAP